MSEPSRVEQDPLIDEFSAAKFLALSVRTLQAWRMKDTGPPFVRVGRSIRYRWSILVEWVKTNTHSPKNVSR
jgi:hypothetical protein